MFSSLARARSQRLPDSQEAKLKGGDAVTARMEQPPEVLAKCIELDTALYGTRHKRSLSTTEFKSNFIIPSRFQKFLC
jgi:hypothetical protein